MDTPTVFGFVMEDRRFGSFIYIRSADMEIRIATEDFTQFRMHDTFCIINARDGDFCISCTEKQIIVTLEKLGESAVGSLNIAFSHNLSVNDVMSSLRDAIEEAKRFWSVRPACVERAQSISPEPRDDL